jgi:hypothetical protein
MFCITLGITSEAVAPITFNVDGKAVTFNGSTGYPYINDRDRIMIPLRVSLEAIGCDVTWNQSSQMVITKKGATEGILLSNARPKLSRIEKTVYN